MSWTEERVSVLKKLWAEGHSASQIAKQLGGVTRNAVIGKVHRLGLSGRATPSRPVKRPPRLARPKPRVLPDGSVKVAAPAAPETPEVRPAAERTEVMAPLPPLQQADGEPASILTLRDSMCKWPIGDPGNSNFHFCGARSKPGNPYCETHVVQAYQPVERRRRKSSGQG